MEQRAAIVCAPPALFARFGTDMGADIPTATDYVRALLKTNQPEFAALLDHIEREFPCPGCRGAFPVMAVAASSHA